MKIFNRNPNQASKVERLLARIFGVKQESFSEGVYIRCYHWKNKMYIEEIYSVNSEEFPFKQ